MKSEYRQVVESIISQEAKLAEVKKMHEEAVDRVAKTSEWVKLNEASLKEYEDRLAELELAILGSEAQAGPKQIYLAEIAAS